MSTIPSPRPLYQVPMKLLTRVCFVDHYFSKATIQWLTIGELYKVLSLPDPDEIACILVSVTEKDSVGDRCLKQIILGKLPYVYTWWKKSISTWFVTKLYIVCYFVRILSIPLLKKEIRWGRD